MSNPKPLFSQGIHPVVVRDGRETLLRPVLAGDAGLVQSFVRALSPQSRRSRFLCGLAELPSYVLGRLTQPAYPAEVGILAVAEGVRDPSVVGMAQYAPEGPGRAELSVAVADAWQRQGLGMQLLRALVHDASALGVETLCAVMLAGNHGMLALAGRLGFAVAGSPEPGLVQVERTLTRAGVPGYIVPAWSYA
jgi:GNAT superfamily N-acetyltransferase